MDKARWTPDTMERRQGDFFPLIAKPRATRGDNRRGEITRDYKIDRPEIHKIVSEGLESNWSPEQISETFRDESGNKRISHQTIYEYLWGLDKGHLHQRSMRRRGKRP